MVEDKYLDSIEYLDTFPVPERKKKILLITRNKLADINPTSK